MSGQMRASFSMNGDDCRGANMAGGLAFLSFAPSPKQGWEVVGVGGVAQVPRRGNSSLEHSA